MGTARVVGKGGGKRQKTLLEQQKMLKNIKKEKARGLWRG